MALIISNIANSVVCQLSVRVSCLHLYISTRERARRTRLTGFQTIPAIDALIAAALAGAEHSRTSPA